MYRLCQIRKSPHNVLNIYLTSPLKIALGNDRFSAQLDNAVVIVCGGGCMEHEIQCTMLVSDSSVPYVEDYMFVHDVILVTSGSKSKGLEDGF